MPPTAMGPALSSTYLSLHFHLVFSTTNRIPFIKAAWIDEFHSYLGGTVAGLGGVPQGTGGVADHVHLLVGLKATHCLADFMRELKKSSSAWVHEKVGELDFAWQEGYAAFTVSPTARGGVKQYIANQEEHHRVKPYRDELIEMLRLAEVEFDEKYLD
jgi:putative transposase